MKSFFGLLSGLTFFAMIVGLIKPSLFQKLFRLKKLGRLKIFGVSLALMIVFSLLSVDFSAPSSSSPNGGDASSSSEIVKSEPVEPEYLLELKSSKCYEEYGYFHITGEVTNISDHSLSNVEAVGNAYTEDKEFVKSDSALVEYNPIMPGQTSPFEVLTTMNPMITKCSVTFKSLMGGTIATRKADKAE